MRSIVVMAVLMIVAALPAAYSALPDYIVLYFNFDEGGGNKAVDLSQYGNNGEITGNPEWVDGKSGKAIHLDGSSVVITVPPSDSLTSLTSPLSVGAWIKPVSFPVEWQCLIEMEGSADDRTNGWKIGFHNQNPVFTTYGHKDHFADQITLNENEWIYFAVVADGTNVNFYINGDLAQQVPFEGTIDVTNSPGVNIGAEKGQPGNWYSDVILDELWVANKALSADEVKTLSAPSAAAVRPSEKLTTTWGEIKK